jgi:cyanophycinase
MQERLISKNSSRLPLAVAMIVILSSVAFAQQRLLVIGGGERPTEAMKTFVEWADGSRARILVITWASAEPIESFEGLRRSFESFEPASIIHAPLRPMDEKAKLEFLEQLRNATGIFFSGGDQNRIMDELSDTRLIDALRARYGSGTPFGGTSAGAAIMSDPMLTGDADLKLVDPDNVGTRPGLGLVRGVIFDQHFLVRQRHNRLFGLMLRSPNMLGIGIDEDTAVVIEDNRKLTVVGKTRVMFIRPKRDGSMVVNFLSERERFDLIRKKRTR